MFKRHLFTICLFCLLDCAAVAALPPEVLRCQREDGLVDLAALRDAGYQGSVNFPGVRLAPGAWDIGGVGEAAKASGDESWTGDFPSRHPAYVYSLCEWSGSLLAASGSEIYRWTGTAWQSLVVKANSSVEKLFVHEGMLVAGGNFTVIGGISANRIARFDGTAWQPLGLGFDDDVDDLTGYVGQLVASGDFQVAGTGYARGIAAWDGTSWVPLGAGFAADNEAADMIEYDGRLIVAGYFHSVGTTIVNHIAAWDGVQWSSLANGMNGSVTALGVSGGRLVASGSFSTAGIVDVDGIAAWDGSGWSNLGSDLGLYTSECTMTSHAGELYLAESRNSRLRIFRLNGTSWTKDFDGEDVGYPNDLCACFGMLAVALSPPYSGDVRPPTVYTWDGANLEALSGAGFDGTVETLIMWDGDLVAGGAFTQAGAAAAYGIARWDGSSWHAVGGGLTNPGSSDHIAVLAVTDGMLVAAGRFAEIGGVEATNVAIWDGTSWAPMGSGLGNAYDTVRALVWDGSSLYAGGDFSYSGAVYVDAFARWNGTNWVRASTTGSIGSVNSLCTYAGQLVVGGQSIAGMGGLAVYSDGILGALDQEVFDTVTALQVHAGDLYVAEPYGGLLQWDGDSWITLLEPDYSYYDNAIRALCSHGDRLIVAGDFTACGDVAAANIAAWDGLGWSRLGSGVSGSSSGVEVYALSTTPWGLAVGGAFTVAGGHESHHMAFWHETAGSPVIPGAAVDLRLQNAPNPFNPQTTISFDLPGSGPVVLTVFDARGAQVRRLAVGVMSAGSHSVHWDGCDDSGALAASGVYFLRLEGGGYAAVSKACLVR